MNEYNPNPFNLEDVNLPADLEDVIDLIAKNVHEVWAKNKILQGWSFGDIIDEQSKRHPSLIRYEELPEHEKILDRDTVKNTLKFVLKLGYKINKTC